MPASASSFLTPPACNALELPPAAWRQACGRVLMMAWRFSLAPLGEPGKVTMTVLFLTPAVGRDIMATVMNGQFGVRLNRRDAIFAW